MFDSFLFIGLPYLSLSVFLAGSIIRFVRDPYSYSTRSSQFLEGRALAWGSTPWHLGVIVVLGGHALGFLFPGLWRALISPRPVLLAVESVGLMAGLLSIIGLVVLLVRRVFSGRVQAVTQTMDLVVLGLLLLQMVLGVGTATRYHWGALWYTTSVSPYLWGLLTLNPEPSFLIHLPLIVKLHWVGAWLILLVTPFSRLVHVFSFPVEYLLRRPILVLWTSIRREPAMARMAQREEGRRHFLKASAGLAGAGALLSTGVAVEAAKFFRGASLTPKTREALLKERLDRMKMNAEEKGLQLEREQKEYIQVARLSQLQEKKGQYFIDYQMRPALAFRDEKGFPILISAKCTHLGCTVGSERNDKGEILCPCHISYFDVKSGVPRADAPAKAPLPMLGWVLMDGAGSVAASRAPGGAVTGAIDSAKLEQYSVYIAKHYEQEERA